MDCKKLSVERIGFDHDIINGLEHGAADPNPNKRENNLGQGKGVETSLRLSDVVIRPKVKWITKEKKGWGNI